MEQKFIQSQAKIFWGRALGHEGIDAACSGAVGVVSGPRQAQRYLLYSFLVALTETAPTPLFHLVGTCFPSWFRILSRCCFSTSQGNYAGGEGVSLSHAKMFCKPGWVMWLPGIARGGFTWGSVSQKPTLHSSSLIFTCSLSPGFAETLKNECVTLSNLGLG